MTFLIQLAAYKTYKNNIVKVVSSSCMLTGEEKGKSFI